MVPIRTTASVCNRAPDFGTAGGGGASMVVPGVAPAGPGAGSGKGAPPGRSSRPLSASPPASVRRDSGVRSGVA
eukprot:11646035-Alexandrium_andersonii.AAC.1